MYLSAAARGVSTCGDILAASALVLALQSAGAGGVAVSALLLAAALPLVVLAPLTGRLVDRVDSRTLLIGTGLVQAAVCLALAYTQQLVLVVALVAVLAAGLAVTQPTLAALVPEMVTARDLPRAMAIGQSAVSVGALAGPALAGVLVGQFGVRVPLLLDAASYLAFAVAGLALRTRRSGGAATARRPSLGCGGRGVMSQPAARWRLRSDPLIRSMVIALTAVIAAAGAINVVEVFFVRETLHSTTTMYGLIAASWTSGMLAGAWLFSRTARRAADEGALVRGVLLQLAGCGAVLVAAAGVPAAEWLVPLFFAGGICNGGVNVYTNVVFARRVPTAARGRAFAAQYAAVQGGMLIGYLAGGVLLGLFAPRALVAATGVAGLLVVAGFAVPVARAVRRERAVVADTSDTMLVAA